jgi:hypothetical protein
LASIKAAIDLCNAGSDRSLPCLEFHITDHHWTGFYLWIDFPVPPRGRLLLNVKINATMLHDRPLLCIRHTTGGETARPAAMALGLPRVGALWRAVRPWMRSSGRRYSEGTRPLEWAYVSHELDPANPAGAIMMSWWTAFAWGTLLVAVMLGVLIAGYYLIAAAAA